MGKAISGEGSAALQQRAVGFICAESVDQIVKFLFEGVGFQAGVIVIPGGEKGLTVFVRITPEPSAIPVCEEICALWA